MNFRADISKVRAKWSPILENMGFDMKDTSKIDWASEYSEYHAMHINENAYANASNLGGLGSVVSPQPSSYPGTTTGTNFSSYGGTIGSGDVAQNLLPLAMKVAGQTIGLDLVAVKPSAGPKIDLLYMDFVYDETNVGISDERPQMFKLDFSAGGATATYSNFITSINAVLNAYSIIQTQGGLAKQNGTSARLFTSISGTASLATPSALIPWTALQTRVAASGTITGGSGVGNNYTVASSVDPLAPSSPQNVFGVVEFLGFGRVDGYPMFRAFKQANTAQTNSYPYINNTVTPGTTVTTWGFDTSRNTFNVGSSMLSQITKVFGCDLTGAGYTLTSISALEDQIPGFVSNFNDGGRFPMDRAQSENVYAGTMGVRLTSKTIVIGELAVEFALRRTQMEDIKANTGIDVEQKMEGLLANELSQTISKQIVSRIADLGSQNRATAPLYAGSTTINSITNATIFDYDTAYVQSGPGGETTHAVQRKLLSKLRLASTYIATEGRVGPAQFAVMNGNLASVIADGANYTVNPSKTKLNGDNQLYPQGEVSGITIYVDPYMKYNDNRIFLGRKNNPDQPGLVFIPYLLGQAVKIIAEATMAPKMLLRTRYAIAELGFFAFKQYMTIIVNDASQYLI